MESEQTAVMESGNQTEVVGQEDRGTIDLKEKMDWFIQVSGDGVPFSLYSKEELVTTLKVDLIAGRHSRDSAVTVHSKKADGTWQETSKTMAEFAKDHFQLRILYEPVWAYALAGLKWGALAGIALKMLDVLIGLATVDIGLAVLFLITLGICCIPRIGIFGICMASFLMIKYSKINFFTIALSAGLVGAMLGCLPGMAIGGLIGLSRRNSLPHAFDATPEPGDVVLKAVILPFIGGAGLLALYFLVINPWLIKMLL